VVGADTSQVIRGADLLACPATGQPLRPCPIEEADRAAGAAGPLTPRAGGGTPLGRTPTVLLRQDGRAAYPVVDGIPVLLGPERLVPAAEGPFSVDLNDPRYAEAYQEMDFYNRAAAVDVEAGARRLLRLAELPSASLGRFPDPAATWLDATYEATAQYEAYRHLAPLDGARVLQLGGKGEQAVAFLLAGAAEAWVVSPMIGELAHARALATRVGVGDRIRLAAGVAEELPLRSRSFDRVWGKSMHHMVDAMAYPQCARVLSRGGRFAAVEPWRALLHGIGTRVLGKRERGVECRPLTRDRLAPFDRAFAWIRVVRHGPVLRYPMIALEKAGVTLPLETAWRLARLDDRLGALLPPGNRGSCATLLGIAA